MFDSNHTIMESVAPAIRAIDLRRNCARVGCVMFVMSSAWLGILCIGMLDYFDFPWTSMAGESFPWFNAAFVTVFFAALCAQIVGSLHLMTCRSYRWASVALAFMVVPGMSLFFWLGMPLAFIGGQMLSRDEYRRLFRT